MNNVVSEVGDFHVEGNIADFGWYQNLRYDNGLVNLNAIVILSEIIYWYKPVEVRDEVTGRLIGYKKKFKADKLQKSYQSLGKNFGLTKGQAKSACKFLNDRGLINIEFRNVPTMSGQIVSNVMFVEPIMREVKKISGRRRILEVSNSKEIPSENEITEVCDFSDTTTELKTTEVCSFNDSTTNIETREVCSSNNTGMEFQQQTYTENTTEITTESKKNIYSSTLEKIIDFLNEKADTCYKASTTATKKVIEARLNEGFNLDDFLKVINIKTTEWMDTDYEKYLRPQTLFGTKFEGYLNQKPCSSRGLPSYHNKNPVDSFSNRKQRKYDIASIERQLLGV
ncbi:hypothetical protein SH2C18_36060 [Clostridium sediminicola]|uniref:conserved phage C-terminal domain-containing protein n=1 Tax=Clostridium sediminicola TaxID=3114879 RepID=UPI0031F240C6